MNKVERRLREKRSGVLATLVARYPWLELLLLRDARRKWRETIQARGGDCPCCGRFGKVYRRNLDSGIARGLLLLSQFGPNGEWVHYHKLMDHYDSRSFGKTQYWGLVEPHGPDTATGAPKGLWRLTETGMRFVRGEITVNQYCLHYDHECLGYGGPQITIQDAFKTPFEYSQVFDAVRSLPGETP